MAERTCQELATEMAQRLFGVGVLGVDAEVAVARDPLSCREREVVQLVARGLTNRKIAERLFISKRTVESHVDHIKQKLGHRSRSEMIYPAAPR
jgi:DNA-binding NarL/FixJ family response regulator